MRKKTLTSSEQAVNKERKPRLNDFFKFNCLEPGTDALFSIFFSLSVTWKWNYSSGSLKMQRAWEEREEAGDWDMGDYHSGLGPGPILYE